MKSNNKNSNRFSKTKHRKTILLADPDETMHQVLSLVFHQRDEYVIKSACYGVEAVEKAETLKGKVDLLLLDFMLADMSGYELYKELSQDTLLGNVPVLFQTGMLNVPKEIKELLRAGKAEVIYKPYNRTELFTVITKLLLKFQP